jgi:hypothetical protein
MFFGTLFNCKWPAKALHDLFTDAKVIPDPEFKSFDPKSLRAKSPDDVQVERDTMADRSVESLKK